MFPIDESVGDRCTGSRGIFESSAIENGIGSLRGMYIKSIDTALIINSEFHTDPEVYCLIVSKSPPPMSRNSRGRQSHTPRSYAIEYFGDWIHKSHSPWTALGDPETALGCILFMDVHNPMAFSLKSEDLVEEIDPLCTSEAMSLDNYTVKQTPHGDITGNCYHLRQEGKHT